MKSSHFTLLLFLLAATALLLTGHVLNPILFKGQMLLLLWSGWSGTYAIYQIGDVFTKPTLKEFFAQFQGKTLLAVFVFQLLFVLPILSWIFLPAICFWTFFGVFTFGLLYSFPFKIGSSTRVLKKIFLVKNTFIGFSWGALILVGAGQLDIGSVTWRLFLFVSLHIFIGSILRDHFDVEKDRENKLKTLPVVMGIERSSIMLNLSNLVIMVVFFFFMNTYIEIIILVSITLYKAVLFFGAARRPSSVLWTQTLNIGFNYLIFILVFILTQYGIS